MSALVPESTLRSPSLRAGRLVQASARRAMGCMPLEWDRPRATGLKARTSVDNWRAVFGRPVRAGHRRRNPDGQNCPHHGRLRRGGTRGDPNRPLEKGSSHRRGHIIGQSARRRFLHRHDNANPGVRGSRPDRRRGRRSRAGGGRWRAIRAVPERAAPGGRAT